MGGTLRKRPGTPPERGMYYIAGSLDGIAPGRRVVRELDVKGLDGHTSEGLAPLVAFTDLRHLHLEKVRNVDLGVLAGVDLELLYLDHVGGIDLGGLSRADGLQWLVFISLEEDCVVPDGLMLPSSLRVLGAGESGRGGDRDPIRRILEAVDWSRLSGLTTLDVRLHDVPPIEVDLAFLRHLGALDSLTLIGVHHRGPAASPLEPPFDGLSRNLRRISIEADDPDAVREGLRRHAGSALEPGVQQRRQYVPPPPSWEIHEPTGTGGSWSAYGSLADAAGLSRDETESKALRDARARLRRADAALLKRLDFDDESAGTAIMAPSRDDLRAALRILGLGEQ